MPAAMPEYAWLFGVGILAAFGFGFGTGANDVANAFATSVGAKTLKLWHAVLLAIVFEFTGALLLGRVTTSVIAGGIANVKDFQNNPEAYAYGMVIALSVGFFWQWWASWKGLNVSATHSIIAGIMGFSLVWNGVNGVNWATPDRKAFPPFKGVTPIFFSWVFSPILTGLASSLLFLTVRTLVLRRRNASSLALIVLPLAVAFTTWINIFFVFAKGAGKTLNWSGTKAATVAAMSAAGATAFTVLLVVPILHVRLNQLYDKEGNRRPPAGRAGDSVAEHAAGVGKDVEGGPGSAAPGTGDAGDVLTRISAKAQAALNQAWHARMWRKVVDVSTAGVKADIHDQIKDDPLVASMHARAEVFSPRCETAFGYLQVFSAICVIFAHGAGEVGYMAGPLATVYEVWQTGSLPHAGGKLGNVASPLWIVAIGAGGLIVGLATFGHHVMRSMGTSLCKLSPTRGFCAELATAMVILIASQFGLPTSSSQCLIGAIVGVGICEGARGVNWKLFGQQVASWAATMVVCVGITGLLFAQGVYTPNKAANTQIVAYKNGLGNMVNASTRAYNSTLYSYRDAALAGAVPGLDEAAFKANAASVTKLQKSIKDWKNASLPQSTAVSPSSVIKTLQSAVYLTGNSTVNTLGQTEVFPGAQLCNAPGLAAIQSGTKAECKPPQW